MRPFRSTAEFRAGQRIFRYGVSLRCRRLGIRDGIPAPRSLRVAFDHGVLCGLLAVTALSIPGGRS